MQSENTLTDQKAAAPGELERLSMAISCAHELVDRFENKLSLVSLQQDIEKDTAAANGTLTPHISNLIDKLNGANARLETLLHNIVL